MTKKVVAICSSEFPPGPGGIGAHAFELASILVNSGYLVLVQSAFREGFDSYQFDVNQKFVVERYLTNRPTILKLLNNLSFLFRNRKKLDWLILSGSNQLYLSLFAKVFGIAKIMSIIHGHEVLMAKGFARKMLLMSLNQCEKVVAVSEFSKEKLLSSGFKRPVNVIPNGISFSNKVIYSDLARSNRDNSRLVIVTVGSVTSRKGQHNVIRAIPLLLSDFKEVEYHIIGIPIEQKAIEQLALELKVKDSVHIHGILDELDKLKILSQSDLFMMLSENLPNGDVEGFGIAVLEANQLGIPAIGSKGTGIEQSIKNFVSGVLVDPRNPQAIRSAVQEVMNNFERYSVDSIQWASKHDWKIIGNEYLSLLNK